MNHQVIHNQENSTDKMGRPTRTVICKRTFTGCAAASVRWIIVVHGGNRKVGASGGTGLVLLC
jgi:hypothetical protein